MAYSWTPPVNASITQQYGVENRDYEAGYHTGIDYGAAFGTRVKAAAKGVVVFAGSGGAYGNYIIVRHDNGLWTLYAHLSDIDVRKGQRVGEGEFIGNVGNSGNSEGAHLHFEVRKGSREYESNVNPTRYFGGKKVAGHGGGGSGGTGGGGLAKSDFGFDPEFLRTHKEIAELVEKAVDKEWSIPRFEAELKQTKWWQNHTVAERSWQIQLTEDPAEAESLLEKSKQDLITMADQMGVVLSDEQVDRISARAVRQGLDPTEIQLIIGQKFRMDKGAERGQAATIVSDIRTMADEFGLPVSRRRLNRWTQEVLSGRQTVEGYADVMREQALAAYSHLAPVLNNGSTVRQWADPYLQQASSLLGVSTDQMRLQKGKYAQLLNPTKDGKIPTMDEWTRTIMKDEKFGYDKTNGAQESASQLALSLGRMMGAT